MEKTSFWVPLLFLFLTISTYAGKSFSLEKIISQSDSLELGLTSMELRKFKKFEEVLYASGFNETEKEKQLTGYARDSLRILEVKLIAIKVLDDKNLLNHDIAENTSYYTDLLTKFQESKIPRSEYLFLEEKLAFINQSTINDKLKWSRWINVGLIALVGLLVFILIGQRKNQNKPVLSGLSKQETLVRNLILQGKSNKEIASELFISLSTVKSHITNIYSKLNVANRQELLANSTGAST